MAPAPLPRTPTFFGVTASQRKQSVVQSLGTENIQISRQYILGERRERRGFVPVH